MQGFFQFNNSIINEILEFSTSACDVLYVSGAMGAGKSEIVAKASAELSKTNLIFQHFCFENSVIDDLLLNFYDTFKNYADSNKISLKKYSAENFEEKIKYYFKIVNKNCIIIIENLELLAQDSEIIDFLTYLSGFKHIKIITVSRDENINPFETKKVICQELEIEQISKKDFKSKFAILAETTDDELKERFYNITGGLELYLNMGVKYCTITGTLPKDLISEFERKKLNVYNSFEEFIVSKFFSLTPTAYLDLLKSLCVISHPVSKKFIEEYKFGSLSHINYLSKNFLVSTFKDEIYVKDYFKNHILKTFSIQEKIKYYQNLVDIYELELEKSPKDRLIRLSRESIRKEIERAKGLIPVINSKGDGKNAFNYIGINSRFWHDDKITKKTKLSEKLNKIKERKNFLEKEKLTTFIPRKPVEKQIDSGEDLTLKLKEEDRRFIISLINSAREYSQNYEYNNAISELQRAQKTDIEKEFEIEILSLIAENYECLDDFNNAIKYYNLALNIALEKDDSRKIQLKFQIASCDKKLYRFDDAIKSFLEIASNETYMESYRIKAMIEIGEIEQADLNNDEAIKYYTTALSLALGKNKELTCKAYYRLAVIYDDMRDSENALKYYKKNCETSSEHRENKYYSVSLTNSALILLEQGETQEAITDFKLALQFDNELNDFENMYFIQRELARIYAKTDTITAIGYYKQALFSANQLKDDFRIANIYFEVGELNCDGGNDEKALVNFLNAQYIMKNKSDSENLAKIQSRINDIKARLDDDTFNLIMKRYDK